MFKFASGLSIGFTLLLMGACATQTLPPGGAATESVITACSSYATALNGLATYKPQMSVAMVDSVNKSNTLVSPICSNPNNYNSSGAISAITTELANLNSVLKTVQGAKP